MCAYWGRSVILTLAALVSVARCDPSSSVAVAKPAGAAGKTGTGGVNIKDLPGILSAEYRVDPFIRAAVKLQKLGKEKAIAALSALAAQADVDEEGKVTVLCRMLFAARPGREFRRRGMGRPVLLGETKGADWPLEPIEIVDGVPFCIVRVYNVAGEILSVRVYLRYCVRECDWGKRAYAPKSAKEKKAALAKLLASPKWKRKLDADERDFLAAQIK
jgi:hypothetical protein